MHIITLKLNSPVASGLAGPSNKRSSWQLAHYVVSSVQRLWACNFFQFFWVLYNLLHLYLMKLAACQFVQKKIKSSLKKVLIEKFSIKLFTFNRYIHLIIEAAPFYKVNLVTRSIYSFVFRCSIQNNYWSSCTQSLMDCTFFSHNGIANLEQGISNMNFFCIRCRQ